MRWLVDIPGLALGDKVVGKGTFIPEGALPQESIDAFVRKGYLSLDSSKVEPKPEIKPLVKARGVMLDNVRETPEMTEPDPIPDPTPDPTPDPEKLTGEIEDDEPLPVVKKRSRKKAKNETT